MWLVLVSLMFWLSAAAEAAVTSLAVVVALVVT